MRRLLIPVSLMLGSGAAIATVPALEDLDRLDGQIAIALGGTAADAGKRAQPVDRRLRMVQCPEGVAFEPPVLGAIAMSCQSKGWRLRVPLIGAQIAQPAEIVIRRGDLVELAFVGTGFDVTTGGTALEDGRQGGVVRVKTSTSTSALTARVRGPGEVEIGD